MIEPSQMPYPTPIKQRLSMVPARAAGEPIEDDDLPQ